jgi:hypothetical protein
MSLVMSWLSRRDGAQARTPESKEISLMAMKKATRKKAGKKGARKGARKAAKKATRKKAGRRKAAAKK